MIRRGGANYEFPFFFFYKFRVGFYHIRSIHYTRLNMTWSTILTRNEGDYNAQSVVHDGGGCGTEGGADRRNVTRYIMLLRYYIILSLRAVVRYFDRKKSFLFCLFDFFFFFFPRSHVSAETRYGHNASRRTVAKSANLLENRLEKRASRPLCCWLRFSANRRCRTLELTAAFRNGRIGHFTTDALTFGPDRDLSYRNAPLRFSSNLLRESQ